jgi:hypothetical protein
VTINEESGLAGDPGLFGLYSDEARRISDSVHLHLLADRAGNHGKWLAFRLSDGTGDDTVYDTPIEAADAQLHYKQCMYVQINHSGMSPKEASVMLNYYRKVYDAGNVPPVLVAYHRAKLALPGRDF